MKSPLWIVNSALALVLLSVLSFIVLSLGSIVEKPRIASIDGTLKRVAPKAPEPKLPDIQPIYQDHDLFGTYKPAPVPEKPVDTLPVIPQPPAPKPLTVQQPEPIHFLEPLPIAINGIIASTNETKSQVTILNNTTKKTESYRVGDKIFDAYIIRIFPKKIIIIRSNGQQETLFMYPSDAEKEVENLKDVSWDDVVQRQSETVFLVNPRTFSDRILSLAHFIEMLDITTALKEDKSIGVKIGALDQKSIGVALGLMAGDTVIKINDTPPLNTENRMALYDEITALDLGSMVKVQLLRKNQLITYEYIFNDLSYERPQGQEKGAPVENLSSIPPASPNQAIKEIKRQDTRAMKQFGSKPQANPSSSKNV